MGLYQKYAKDTAIWIDLPDPSKRIRDQGLKTLRDMESVRAHVRQEEQLILNRMAENAKIERDNRASNFKLAKSYRDTEKEAERRQQKTVLNNIEIEEANRKRRSDEWRQLIEFLPQAGKQLQDIDKKWKEDAMLTWRQWHDEFGITSKDLAAVASIDKHQWTKSKHDNAIWQSLRARGIPEHLIEKMRGINSYGKLAVASVDAQNIARSWGTVIASRANEKFDVAGREIDFNTAYASGDPVILREVFRRITRAEMQKYEESGSPFPSTKIWEYSGSSRIKREIETQFLSQQQNKAIKDARENRHEDELALIEKSINNYDGPTDSFSNGKGIILAIEHRAGPNPTRSQLNLARKEIIEAVSWGVMNGRIPTEDAEDLLKTMFRPKAHGEGGPLIKFGDHFHKEREQLLSAIKNRRDTDAGRLQSSMNDAKQEAIKMELDYRKIVEESPDIGLETLTGLHSAAVKEHGANSGAAKYIADRIASQNVTINDGLNAGYIRERIQNNEHITRKELEALKLSKGIEATLWAEIQEANVFLPSKDRQEDARDIIEKELRKRIAPSKLLGHNSSRKLAEDGAYARFLIHYTNLTKSQVPPDKAFQDAIGLIRRDIFSDDDDWKPTVPSKANGGVREFEGFNFTAPRNEDLEVANLPQLKDQLSTNPGLIYEAPYIDREALAKKAEALRRGKNAATLPISGLLANYTGNKYSPIEMEMAQIGYYNSIAEAEGLKPIQEYPEWYVNSVKKAEEIVHPLALQYLSTPGYVNQAVVKQGRNPVYQDYSYTKVDKMVFGEGGYNLVTNETRSTSSVDIPEMKYHLTDATCDQANRISLKYESDLGRYKLKKGTILEGCKLAGLKPTDKFNRDNQTKIFKALFKQNGLSMFDTENLSDKDKLYIQHTHQMLNGEELSTLKFNDPAILSPLAYQIKWDLGTYTTGVAA